MSNWECEKCHKIFDRFEPHLCGDAPEWLKQIYETLLGENLVLGRLKRFNYNDDSEEHY